MIIEKFNPNDPELSEKVKERLNDLKAKGKEIGAFYDKSTGKIFINENLNEEKIRPSIAREWKIKEDLELGKGKANDKGELRSTVAGEIAYDEVLKRTENGNKSPLKTSNFIYATMNSDTEVTSDLITKEELKFRKDYQDTTREYHLPTGERFILLKEGFMEFGKGVATATTGTFLSPYGGIGIPAIVLGTSTGIEGLNKIGASLFARNQDLGIAVNPIRDSVFNGNQNAYEATENFTMIGTTIIAQNYYNNSLSKTVESPRKQLENLGIKVEERNIGLQVDGTTTRGLEIDEALGNNLGTTFKTFDNFKDGVATSVKSIYLDGKTYKTGAGLYYKLNKDLRAISNFNEYRTTISNLSSQNINTRVLQIIMNNQTLNNTQIENLRRISENANKMNIKIEAIILK